MSERWVTHKFGGSSLADADAYRVATTIVEGIAGARRAVVVSAMAGMTDGLIDVVERAGRRDPLYEEQADLLKDRQIALAEELMDGGTELVSRIEKDFVDIKDVLRASWVMRSVSEEAVGTVAGFGEVWAARLFSAYLERSGIDSTWIDARDVLVVRPADLMPVVDWEASRARLDGWLTGNDAGTVVITGYIAADQTGAPTTLGRNGSDYSASIFAKLLGADEIVIWTDVDGVLSADPRLVPQTQVLDELSFDEAIELAYFGARVIHPATMGPAIDADIPITIRNTFNPSAPGTRIHPRTTKRALPVKGFASIGDLALVNLEGTAMLGVPGISERLFGGLRRAGVSVVMISQGSSEHSICFAVPETEAENAAAAIAEAFEMEMRYGQIQPPQITTGCTILAAVGDGMAGTPGIAARFFGALARTGVNVRAIAQGSSERNITIVIDSADAARALRAAHSGFYLSPQTLSIGIIGPGHVGSTLLDQLGRRTDWLKAEFGVDLRVRAIANSSAMALDEHRIDLGDWRSLLSGPGAGTNPVDLERLADYVHTESVPHAVIIDCSASDTVAGRYVDWLNQGIHVITPNKRANTGPMEAYRALQGASRRGNAHYLYETTVGAALPIIQTLRDLVQTGDEIRRIEGIFSGTLSYLLNSFDGSQPFSAIVAAARAKGYTEPDPREDLSGLDVARKVVILAREMGMDVELPDVVVEGLVPPGLDAGSADDFMARLADFDGDMQRLVEVSRSRGEVLRFVGAIDPEHGLSVRMRSYDAAHDFSRIRHTDNIVEFETARYSENPLVVQGPGAGPEVTAGGVFADLLRLANYLGANL
jgi:bifunctional aspartokinase / homoserine dehydrogenase 1